MQAALAAAEKASSLDGSESSTCRDAFEHALAILNLKQGKAANQLVLYQQQRPESRLSLYSGSGDESEGLVVAIEDLYGSFQVGISTGHADTASLEWLLCSEMLRMLCCAVLSVLCSRVVTQSLHGHAMYMLSCSLLACSVIYYSQQPISCCKLDKPDPN